jgi:predicted MFS family arabinose efflux permease
MTEGAYPGGSPARQWANVGVLALCQGLAMSASALIVTVTALVGRQLAPAAELATLPLALQYLAMTLAAVPISWAMQRYGRRAGFTLGHALGVAGGLIGCHAVLIADFRLYCLASGLIGLYVAHSFHHRFAASEAVPASAADRALGLVMAGGVLAALAGPQLAGWSKDLFAPITFAGSWLAVAGLAAVGLVAVQSLSVPSQAATVRLPTLAGARRLLRRPAFVRAMAAAAVAYAAMNLLMTATPVAVTDCHLPFATAAFVIQWHVFAMHAPSFFTGELIRRWGSRAVMLLGAGLMAASAGVGLAGVAVANFASALVLLGVGWNFLFVGATALLVRSYDAADTAEAQGLHDTVLFATIALSSLGAGWLYAAIGWAAMNALTLLPLGAVALWVLLAGREPEPARVRPGEVGHSGIRS